MAGTCAWQCHTDPGSATQIPAVPHRRRPVDSFRFTSYFHRAKINSLRPEMGQLQYKLDLYLELKATPTSPRYKAETLNEPCSTRWCDGTKDKVKDYADA